MPSVPDLESLLERVLGALHEAVADPRHEWHMPVVATLDSHGNPTSRTVVLRHFAAGTPRPWLSFHTDARSPKAAQIRAQPRVAWLFYDRSTKVQLRVSTLATLHLGDALADQAWQGTTLSSRRCYLAPRPPSSVVPEPDPNLPQAFRRRLPDRQASEAGRHAFAVVRSEITELERLELHHDGHVRCRWRWAPDGRIEADWLAP